MKVKELIKKLNALNHNINVFIESPEGEIIDIETIKLEFLGQLLEDQGSDLKKLGLEKDIDGTALLVLSY